MSRFKKGLVAVLVATLVVFVLSIVITIPVYKKHLTDAYEKIILDGEHTPGWDTADLYLQSLLPVLTDQGFHPANFGQEMFHEFSGGEYIYNFVSKDGMNDDGGQYTISFKLYIDGLHDFKMNQVHFDDYFKDADSLIIDELLDESNEDYKKVREMIEEHQLEAEASSKTESSEFNETETQLN